MPLPTEILEKIVFGPHFVFEYGGLSVYAPDADMGERQDELYSYLGTAWDLAGEGSEFRQLLGKLVLNNKELFVDYGSADELSGFVNQYKINMALFGH